MIIIWSNKANIDNLENIEYLLEEWNLKVVLDYEQKILGIEKLLISNPQLGNYDKELGLYKILLVPQIYIIYEIIKNDIVIIRVWNNYKKPYW